MKHFTLAELSRSATAAARGIDNTPTPAAADNLRALVADILDPLRTAWGQPITVNSGYRCPALNAAVGGAPASQHLRGEAADITAGTPEANRRLFALIQSLDLSFDQLIDERDYAWIHVSHRRGSDRRQILHLRGSRPGTTHTGSEPGSPAPKPRPPIPGAGCLIAAIALTFTSCSPRVVTVTERVPVVVRDTVARTLTVRDSVRVVERLERAGDTVHHWHTVARWRETARADTIVRTDTLTLTRTVTLPARGGGTPLWQQALAWVGAAAAGMALALIIRRR